MEHNLATRTTTAIAVPPGRASAKDETAHARRATATMRAAVLESPGVWGVREVATPIPSDTQVRIEVRGCGVCASNLPVWEGMPWFEYPFAPGAPGHEAWGVVESVGSAVRTLAEGTPVTFLCDKAYADYAVADAGQVVRLPSELGQRPFPGEPLGCAMKVFERSDVHAGQTIAVVGIGFLGALLTRLAVTAGADVIAITRRQYALGWARELGAADVVPMENHQAVVERVHALTDGKGCSRVIEAVGKQWPLDLAAELVRERGRLVVAGYHQDGPRQVNMQQWNWKGIDVVNAHERAPHQYIDGMHRAISAIEDGRIDPFPLYTHSFKLESLQEAFEVLAQRPDGFMKGLIVS